MNMIFQIGNLLVLPLWALMIALPRWRWTERIMRSPLVVAPFAVIYSALVLPRIAELWPTVSSPTLDGVTRLLGQTDGATIGWVHFLAFDLFVGRWAFLESRERRISPLLMAPVLFLTLMLGPLGFVVYLIVRAVATPAPQPSTPPRTADAGA